MARTVIPVSAIAPTGTVDPTGTAVDPTNGHYFDAGEADRCLVRINSTFAGAKTFTIKGGALPGAGGDLVISANAQVKFVGPLSTGRYKQADGSIWIDVAAAATGDITVLKIAKAV